jgi:hypothetical protein
MKEYYYLHKADKIGPISEEDLLKLNLNSDTLVWEKSFENWTKLCDIPDLNKKMPPPLPESYLKTSKKIKLSILSFFTLLIAFSGITYLILNSLIEDSKSNLRQKVESIFNNRNIICDGINYAVKGELERYKFEKTKISGEKTGGKIDPFALSFRNNDYEHSQRIPDNELFEILKKRGYYDYFNNHLGGFQIKKLTKIDNGYELEFSHAKNMVFKSYQYYRSTVENAYSETYDYLIEANETFYQQGTYRIIDNFPALRSRFHGISNVVKPSDPWADYWWYENLSVYTSSWSVFYKREHWYYEITPDKYSIKEFIVKAGIFESVILIVLVLILLIFNPLRW